MRDTPRFTRDEIDPGLLGDGLDDAFQGFLGELLAPQLPGIATWSAAGKDGGIDLRAPGAKQTVVEAKVVGSDGLSSIAPRWKKTRDNLNRNLATPDGPPKGQSQYAPWYDKGNPIGAYWFCTTASFANAAQEDKLQKEIETFFRETLGTMPHLDHLADIQVEILGWNKLASQVKPHHLFRWFRQSRPMGLKPLEESTDERRFHAYLTNARLPYYSRAQQLQRHPAAPGLDIPDEQALLDSLADDDGHGMVVVGAGGVGKTRLTLELTWRARDAGWTVLRVGRRLAPGVLEDLAAQLSPADHLIVWLDYVETQADFAELVERIGDLNDSQGLNLRFLASCRTSYLPSLQAVYDYHLVDLSPPDGTAAWLDAHRRATVAHILRQGGLVASGPALTLCGDVPVLAVFLSWLKAQGRTADLQSLLGEKDFGDWLIKRLEQTFPGEGIQPKLATLMGLLPLGTGTLAVSDEPMAVLVHSLAADGWIERLPKNDDEAERWVPPHDVFADQIMIAWLRRIPNTRRDFAPALLRAAAVHDACDSALTSLQRVAPYFGLNSSEWATILIEACRVNPDSWRRHRGLLLRTSLLEPKDKIQLIHSLPGFWENIAGDMDVAMPLGWLCRWATKVAAVPLDDDLMEDLTAAIQTASQGMLRNNFPLTHGLRLAPSLLAGRALAWLEANPTQFQTHFLVVAWLECGLGVAKIRATMQTWAQTYCHAYHLTFLAGAWLDAGGECELVRKPIGSWLDKHAQHEDAQFVYKAWLDAGGEHELVHKPIGSWLDKHAQHENAQFVYKAWLDAGGECELVHRPIGSWLEKHTLHEAAGFVFKSWLQARGDFAHVRDHCFGWLHEHRENPDAVYPLKFIVRIDDLPHDTVCDILAWCKANASNEDAIWRLAAISLYLRDQAHAVEALRAADAVLRTLTSTRNHLPPAVRIHTSVLVADLYVNPGLRAGEQKARLLELLAAWLSYRHSYSADLRAPARIQHPIQFMLLLELLEQELLSVSNDRDAIMRYLAWVDGWLPMNKGPLDRAHRWAQQHYAAEELWDRLHIPDSTVPSRN